MLGGTIRWGRRCRLPVYDVRVSQKIAPFSPDDAYLFLTWRLWGPLPARTDATVYPTAGHAFLAHNRALDRRRSGPLWLGDPRIADVVAETFESGMTRGTSMNLVLGW